MDLTEVWSTTWTNLHINIPSQQDESGMIWVEIRVDAQTCGTGRGNTLGQAIVAAGIDMMGISSELLLELLSNLSQK